MRASDGTFFIGALAQRAGVSRLATERSPAGHRCRIIQAMPAAASPKALRVEGSGLARLVEDTGCRAEMGAER